MLPRSPEEATTKEVTMPKPYSILAAALVASGRSLSTVNIAGPINSRALRPTRESENWFANPDRMGVLNFQAPFAIDLSAECTPAAAHSPRL
jgi:hypothetical protein